MRSPGRRPNSVTLENIKLGVHTERNRTIARLLTQLGYMSAIGTGIPRLIIRLTRDRPAVNRSSNSSGRSFAYESG